MNMDILFFFEKRPEALELYLRLEQKICTELSEVKIKVHKTQINFANRYNFAVASLPRRKTNGSWDGALMVSFGLPDKVESPRIVAAVEAYPSRWTHHVLVSNLAELDEELMGWIREAYAFSATKG